MNLAEALKAAGIDCDSGGYRSALLQMRANLKLSEDTILCDFVAPITYWVINSVGSAITNPRPGVLCCMDRSILILCPADNDIAIARIIKKSEMRVYGYEDKLFKSTFTIKLNADSICFQVPKKQAKEIDKAIRRIGV